MMSVKVIRAWRGKRDEKGTREIPLGTETERIKSDGPAFADAER